MSFLYYNKKVTVLRICSMRKRSLAALGIGVVTVGALGVYGLKHKDANDSHVVDESEHGVVQDGVRENTIEGDVSGITAEVFSGMNIAYTTTIAEDEFEDQSRQWLIVSLEDRNTWDALGTDEREEIMRGLVNTSRLQIDRDFGGVQILFGSETLMHGWWSDEGYVIL
jgi:hypothetical protein